MSPIHPTAERGFGSDAARYDLGRPGYPDDAVAWLTKRLGIDTGSVVVDVGAGTGKLTRHLAATGADVIAVEPVDAMATILRQNVPTARVVAATAENLPFTAGTVDALVAAQAFHWFDRHRAWAEFRRVLRPGGGVGLIWNARDRSVSWVDDVWEIMDEVEKKAPWRDPDRPALAAGDGFAPLEHREFFHTVPVTAEIVVARIASVSHVAVLPDRERATVLDRVRRAVPDGELSMRYRVDAYVTAAA